MPPSRKVHVMFPNDHQGRVRWIFQHFTVRRNLGTVCVQCNTSIENADLIVGMAPQLSIGARKHGAQQRLRLRPVGMQWLQGLRDGNPTLFAGSHLAASWQLATEAVAKWDAEYARTRSEIVAMCEQRQGHPGCAICKGVKGPFEFDHIEPATKVMAISSMLEKGYFGRALEEGGKCQLLHTQCHREKTEMSGDRLCRQLAHSVPSSDTRREKELAYQRLYNRKRCVQGNVRNKTAKITRGECANCHQKCTTLNLLDFDWVFMDQANKGRRNISGMSMDSDRQFFTKLKTCDLLCHGCHMQQRRKV